MIEQLQHIETGRLEFLAKQVVEGFITGLHKSPFHGFSVEFAEHRAYNKGESIRNIDWKLFARTDKLYVKQYDEETNLRCMLLLDNSPSMHFPPDGTTKFQVASLIGATLIELLRKQRDACGLTLFSDRIEEVTPVKSNQAHIRFLYQLLTDRIEKGKTQKETSQTDLAKSLHLIAEKVHRRSLVILFSDLLTSSHDNDAVFDALQHLKFNKHEIIIFNVMDRSLEEELLVPNKPSRFVDVETGEELKLQPAEIKEAYTARMNQFKKEWKLRCAQYRIEWVEVDALSDPSEFLIPFLLKRNRMS
jgi:uncharacterized protein (DUF58 family)